MCVGILSRVLTGMSGSWTTGGFSLSGSHSIGGQCARAYFSVDGILETGAGALSLCCLLWKTFGSSSSSAGIAVRSFLWLRTPRNIRCPAEPTIVTK